MATLEQLEAGLRAADSAGNEADARRFAIEIAKLRRQQAAPTASQMQPTPQQQSGSFIDPLMQGLTFGWSDELGGLGARLGAMAAGASPERQSQVAAEEIERQRQALSQFGQRNPLTSMGLQLAGSIPSSVALGIGQTPLRMMELGAAGGALAGMGAAEDNKALGGALGGVAGGLLAGAVPAAINLAQRATAAGKGALAPLYERWMQEPQTRAGNITANLLQAGGVTPAALRSRARQIGPQATVAEAAGPAGVVMGQGVIGADKTGKAKLLAEREFGKRTPGMSNRLRQSVAETTGVTQRLQPTLDAVRQRQQAIARPMYERAYSQEIPLTDTLKSILKRGPAQSAFQAAKEAAETVGDELPPLFKLNDIGEWEKAGVMPDMRAWDRIKQGIDRLIDNETDAVTGRLSPKGRDLTILKRQLVDELDQINPVYREARMLFAGDEALQNAMRTGEKFLGMKTRQVHSAIGDMNNSEREAFLVGAVEAIREKIGGAKAGQMRSFNFLESDNAMEKLRAIFPAGRQGDIAIARLKRSIGNERLLNETITDLLRGSQTHLRDKAEQILGKASGIPTSTEMFTSPVRGAAGRMMQSAANAIGRERQATLEQLSKMLFEPGMVEPVIAELQRRGIPKEAMFNYINSLSKGSAALSPAAGLGLGGMVQ